MKITSNCHFILSIFLLISCRTLTQSNTDFAISPPNQSVQGILGMMEVKRLGDFVDFDKISVCIGNGKGNYSTNNFFLETKLAYATWINASGNFSENEWNYFNFVQDPNCHKNQQQYQIAVYINEDGAVEVRDRETGLLKIDPNFFKETKFKCSHNIIESNYDCQNLTGRVTLGVAGPAPIVYSYTDNGNKWTKIKYTKPSTLILTPFYDLQSLEADLNNREDIDSNKKEQFLKLYQNLMDTNNQSYGKILELSNILQELQIQAVDFPLNLLEEYNNRGFSTELADSIKTELVKIVDIVKNSASVSDNDKKNIAYNYKYFFIDKPEFEIGAVGLIVSMAKNALGNVSTHPQLNEIISKIKILGVNEYSTIKHPYQTTYHILLHEAGHQMGVWHAHEKDFNYITGTQITKTVINEDGSEKVVKEIVIANIPGDGRTPFVTNDAVMAYTGNPLFLSDNDDQPAIKLLANSMQQFLKRRKSGQVDPNLSSELSEIARQPELREFVIPNIQADDKVKPVTPDDI